MVTGNPEHIIEAVVRSFDPDQVETEAYETFVAAVLHGTATTHLTFPTIGGQIDITGRKRTRLENELDAMFDTPEEAEIARALATDALYEDPDEVELARVLASH